MAKMVRNPKLPVKKAAIPKPGPPIDVERLLTEWRWLMATIQDLVNAVTALAAAVAELKPCPPPLATQEQLDAATTGVQAATAAVVAHNQG